MQCLFGEEIKPTFLFKKKFIFLFKEGISRYSNSKKNIFRVWAMLLFKEPVRK